jgi:hypothetical protein
MDNTNTRLPGWPAYVWDPKTASIAFSGTYDECVAFRMGSIRRAWLQIVRV